MTEQLTRNLGELVGNQHVLQDETERSFYAQDVFTKALPAGVVVQPANKEELAAVVKDAVAAGRAVIARGGGMSYTSGYVPAEENAVLIDTARMNRVLELNTEDMYVTVEAGITWEALNNALEGTGLRTPYWGTLSGIKATVGGSLSQNAIFWGSGRFGSAADSVISMEVVLADGSVICTGSASQSNASPFFRHFGPDLTGLFTADCGTLGIKAAATLQLIPDYRYKRFASLGFSTHKEMIPAMSEIARQGIASECFGFDPYLQEQRMRRESLTKDVKQFFGVLKSAGGVVNALKDGAKIAAAGRGFMDNVDYSFHVMVEEQCEEAAEASLRQIKEIAKRYNGEILPDSIPKLVRANPFTPLNTMIGPDGERWLPVHALLPHSKALDTIEKAEALFDRHKAVLDQFNIRVGALFATVSTNCFVFEPVFFWPDALTEIHERSIEADVLAKIKGFPEDLAARDAVKQVRGDLVALFKDQGAVHLQIGKTYLYKEGLKPEAWQLVSAIKQAVDPTARVNPQCLGLG